MINKKLFALITFLVMFSSLTLNGIICITLNHRNTFKNLKSNSDNLSIITPENKTYTSPMSGYYPASYGFENDNNGVVPKGWSDASPYSSCSVLVQDEKDQHKKIVQITDGNTATGADAIAQYNFISPQVSGTIECWVYKESGDSALVIQGNDGTTVAFMITIDAFNNGIFRYSPAPSTYIEFAPGMYSDNTWFHIRIDFNCITDTTDIYVNGIKEIEDGLFHLPVSEISYIQIRSGYSGTSGILYFDAVGLSGIANYNIGDNKHEGLLLSYNNNTNLAWMGYSLDNYPNRTIYGNMVILMPSNGVHSIKIAGIDSLDNTYQSALRVFSINYQSSPPNNFSPDQLLILLVTIIGVIAAIGLTLAVYFLVIKPRRKLSSTRVYESSPTIEESPPKGPIRENLPPIKTIIQCPSCSHWNDIGWKYCAICGHKLPEKF